MDSERRFPSIFGKYKLLRELARGGMGAVYLAAAGARGVEKVCALKVVLPNLATPEYLGRFMDEAKVMVRLSHGNLVQVFDVGEVEDEAYIAMEYVDGQDVRALWNRCVEVRRAFPVDVAVHLVKEACRGLAYAHTYEGLKLVHRDISPPNIMVTFAGETKVMDFGLAHSAIKLEHTQPGLVFGKVPYMAPEQARGDELSARTDLFALGVVLWELLTGKRLFPSSGDQAADIGERARIQVIPSTREHTRRVPPGLDALVLKALAVAPEDRFASAAEMSAALGRFLSTNWPGTDTLRVGAFMEDLFGAERVQERQRLEAMLSEAAALERAGPEAAKPKAPDAPDKDAVGGRYRLVRLLGKGGMGEVWEAEHTDIGKRFAVKLLHRGYSRSKDLVARFKREARVASRIDHPGIPAVTDFGIAADGRLFFVMELLEGRLLSDLLDGAGPLDLSRAVDIGLQICSALTAAHESDLVHRDLKPDNVMLVRRNGSGEQVKVLDFGIAKELSPAQNADRLTVPGTRLGTPEYMAPEQAAGGEADARSDVYAVGVLLYEMMTGAPPHTGETAHEVLRKKLHEPITPIAAGAPGLPEPLAAIIMRCLAASPDARPTAMREVAVVLEQVRAGLGAEAGGVPLSAALSLPSGGPRKVGGWRRRTEEHTEIVERAERSRRWPWIAAFGGGVALALALALALTVGSWGRGAAGSGSATAASTHEAGSAGSSSAARRVAGSSSAGSSSAGFMTPAARRAAALATMRPPGDVAPGRRSERRPGADRVEARRSPPGAHAHARAHAHAPSRAPNHLGARARPESPRDPPRRATTRAEERARARELRKQASGHIAAGRWSTARQTLLELARIRGYRGVALTGLARLAFERGHVRDAAEIAQRAVRAGGGNRARMIWGNSLLKLGQHAAAARIYRTVLRRSPSYAAARRNLAIAERHLGGG